MSSNSSGNPGEVPASLEEENEYTVAYWRKQFIEIRPKLKRNWHQQLAAYEPTLDSLKGANDMRAVSHGKASIVVTQHIVSILTKMVTKQVLEKQRQQRSYERFLEKLRRIQGG